MHTYIDTYIDTYVHTHTLYIYMHIRYDLMWCDSICYDMMWYVYIYMHMYSYVCIYTYMHIYIYTYIHVYTHIYTYDYDIGLSHGGSGRKRRSIGKMSCNVPSSAVPRATPWKTPSRRRSAGNLKMWWPASDAGDRCLSPQENSA